jgi:hypothetical protein
MAFAVAHRIRRGPPPPPPFPSRSIDSNHSHGHRCGTGAAIQFGGRRSWWGCSTSVRLDPQSYPHSRDHLGRCRRRGTSFCSACAGHLQLPPPKDDGHLATGRLAPHQWHRGRGPKASANASARLPNRRVPRSARLIRTATLARITRPARPQRHPTATATGTPTGAPAVCLPVSQARPRRGPRTTIRPVRWPPRRTSRSRPTPGNSRRNPE